MLTFRIATYNIHKCRGLDRRVRPERIVEVLKETSADVTALQEVVGMDHVDPQHNQVRWIADELGFHYRIGGNRRLHGAAYGNAVLTRFPIAATHFNTAEPRRRLGRARSYPRHPAVGPRGPHLLRLPTPGRKCLDSSAVQFVSLVKQRKRDPYEHNSQRIHKDARKEPEDNR